MKILHITSHLDVGGIPRYILSLSEQLIKKGHRVVIASAGGRLEESAGAIGTSCWPIPLKTSQEVGFKVLRSIWQIVDRLKQEPVDIIHAHTRVGQVVADQVSRRLKVPYVTTWHGIYKPRWGRKLYPCVGRACIAISGMVQEHLLRDFGIPAGRIRLIYNGVNAAYHAVSPEPAVVREHRKRWRIPEGKPVIGSIGRLAAGKVKGFDLLLAAACLLKKNAPDIQVLIVGDGPRRPFLEDVAERLAILDDVRFVGGVEDVRIPLALIDVFVFSSRWPEAFGLTLIEAMAAGKPVVATRIGAVPEIIQEGVNGFIAGREDIEGVAEHIERLLSDRTLAQRMGRQAQIRVRERFTIERMAGEVERVYQEVLAASREA